VLQAVKMPPTRPAQVAADLSLVDFARRGDRTAFGELVRLHQRRVYSVCRQYLGPDEADAATQDAFVKAYSRLRSFDGRSAFSTWITRIAINTCLDQLRRLKREGSRVAAEEDDTADPLEHLPDGAADPEALLMQRQALERLGRCEDRLPAQQREVFRLRFYAELPLEEIADALEVSVGTVKTQLHRAVHRVRQELGDVR
jgi:RNA polymerase sigma-70 factor (ECF subfamily)